MRVCSCARGSPGSWDIVRSFPDRPLSPLDDRELLEFLEFLLDFFGRGCDARGVHDGSLVELLIKADRRSILALW
jgi:hypothetical protein